jgi:hypothetical protein
MSEYIKRHKSTYVSYILEESKYTHIYVEQQLSTMHRSYIKISPVELQMLYVKIYNAIRFYVVGKALTTFDNILDSPDVFISQRRERVMTAINNLLMEAGNLHETEFQYFDALYNDDEDNRFQTSFSSIIDSLKHLANSRSISARFAGRPRDEVTSLATRRIVSLWTNYTKLTATTSTNRGSVCAFIEDIAAFQRIDVSLPPEMKIDAVTLDRLVGALRTALVRYIGSGKLHSLSYFDDLTEGREPEWPASETRPIDTLAYWAEHDELTDS